eukprot:GGOE01006393.1.p1 GENE.GGOE01006393.1~~GGOE01006393.1.p1  ORF type:complete len:233 (-),score=60.06 GGOE01006393.1:658-1317(-)
MAEPTQVRTACLDHEAHRSLLHHFEVAEIEELKVLLPHHYGCLNARGIAYVNSSLELLKRFVEKTGPLKRTKVKIMVDSTHLEPGNHFLGDVWCVVRTKRFHRRGKRFFVTAEGLTEASGALLMPMSVLEQASPDTFKKGKRKAARDHAQEGPSTLQTASNSSAAGGSHEASSSSSADAALERHAPGPPAATNPQSSVQLGSPGAQPGRLSKVAVAHSP